MWHRWLPLLLGSVALFLDAWRLAEWLAGLVDDSTVQVLVRFLALGGVGAGLVFAGLEYNKHRVRLAEMVAAAFACCAPCALPPSANAQLGAEDEGGRAPTAKEGVATSQTV